MNSAYNIRSTLASEFDWGYVEVPQRQHTTILIMRMALYGVKLLIITYLSENK